jgi:RNA polymerase sigma-70 factor (ECF subfamily)
MGRFLNREHRTTNAGHSSASLFVRARERPETFGDVFRAYHEPVLRFMARRTFDPETATDLTAETFAKMLANLGKFRGSTEEQGREWMWTVARNQLADWHRRGHVERRYIERVGVRVDLLPDEYARIEELADFAVLRGLVRRALERLRDVDRQVLQLRVVDERSYDEIAEVLGTTVSAVRQRVSKALREVAQHLDELGDDEGFRAKELQT